MSDSAKAEPDRPAEPTDQRRLPAVMPRSELLRPQDNWFFRAFRFLSGWRNASLRAELAEVLDEQSAAETGLSPSESLMLRNILHLRERRIADLSVPRTDIIGVDIDISLGELIKTFETAAHSRLVVYRDTLDDPLGIVHIRDFIAYVVRQAASAAEANTRRKKPFPAGLDLKGVDLAKTLAEAALVREALFVPPSMPALDLLERMQASRIHLALMIDEYGGTDGLVSMEDIVEEIVGEIDDEHDEKEAPTIAAQPDGTFIADARTPLEEVVATVGDEFDIGDAGESVDTLGGYLVHRAGRVPTRGEIVAGPARFEIEVLDADPKRVKRLKIARRPDQRDAASRPAS